MRAYELAAVVLGMVTLSPTARSQEAGAPIDVTVYVTGASLLSSSENQAAKTTVSGMFARVGVHITWLEGKPKDGEPAATPAAIFVRFVRQPMSIHSSGALAYASPFAEGVKTITVLYDRIRLVAGGPKREPRTLAHVLAHELGHVLQGTNRHAPTGVMKATWDGQDYEAMEKEPLEFTSTDVDLIREGLNRPMVRAGDRADGGSHSSGRKTLLN